MIITMKLYSGLQKDLALPGYDPAAGIEVSVDEGTRLRGALKKLGIKSSKDTIFFRDTIRITGWTRLRDGDVISIIRASGGG